MKFKRLLVVAGLLLVSGTAQAATYTFSFTTSDALNALATTDPLFLLEGYYAFFLQPLNTQIPINTYSYGYMHSAKEVGPDRWQATSIVDPSNPVDYSGNPTGNLGPGRWAQFSKLAAQTEVTLASRANGGPGDSNIFITNPRFTFFDNGITVPFAFGTTVAEITSLLPEDGVFSFRLTLAGELNEPVAFRGFASAIRSLLDDSVEGGGKPSTRAPFSLTLTPVLTATPEPGSLVLSCLGIAALTWWRMRIRRKSDNAIQNAVPGTSTR